MFSKAFSIFAVALLALTTGSVWGQNGEVIGVPEDWSHHHMVFSQPTTPEQQRVQADPRYRQQLARRDLQYRLGAVSENVSASSSVSAQAKKSANAGLWEVNMGNGAGVGIGNYPAKYSFNTGSANCGNASTPDFTVYNTSLAGTSTQATVVAFRNLYSGCTSTNTRSQASVVLTKGTLITFPASTITSADIGSVIADTSHSSYIPSGTVIATVTSTTAGTISQAATTASTDSVTITPPVPQVYWSYNTATGYKVATSVVVSLAGSAVAFVQSNGSSSDLVILNWAAGEGLPKYNDTNVADTPATPANLYTTGAAYEAASTGCAAKGGSCQLTLAFNSQANVTRSSPYYDYSSDTLYVGDDAGKLHKFAPVFNGNSTTPPGEVTTGGWPVAVSTAASKILTAPVEDANTHTILVGDYSGNLYYVMDTGNTIGTCGSGTAPCLGKTSIKVGSGMVEAPLIDSTLQKVFAFGGVVAGTATYTLTETTETVPTTGNTTVTFTGTSGDTFTSFPHIGAFDNGYYSAGTGNLYFCAPLNNSAAAYNHATLYRIPLTTGTISSTTVSSFAQVEMVQNSPSGQTLDDCSPMTEFLNGSNDYLFFTVAQNAGGTSNSWPTGTCGKTAGGSVDACVYTFNINSFSSSSVPSAVKDLAISTGDNLGSSGIVVDNALSSPAGTSEIYLTPVPGSNITCTGLQNPTGTGQGSTTGGCAIQASQSALQ